MPAAPGRSGLPRAAVHVARGAAVTRPGIRHAMLKPAFAHLYPGIAANEWQPVAVLMDQVIALRLRALERVPLTRDRALDDAHFEFRGVASMGSADAVRQARLEERRRRLSAE